MKKTLLALAVAALSANAFALDLGKDEAIKYASEIKLDSAEGTVIALPAGQSVDTKLGFSINQDNIRYVRYDISGAEFGTITSAMLTFSKTGDFDADPATPDTTVPVNHAVNVSSQTANYVVFEIKAAEQSTSDLAVRFAPAVKAKAANTATVQYRLYETGVDASNGTANVLGSAKSGSLLTFVPALEVAFLPQAENDRIDVTQASKYFSKAKEDVTSVLGSIKLALSGANWTDGQAAEIGDLVAADKNVLTVQGNFASAAKVTLDATEATAAAKTLTGTAATFALADAAAVQALNGKVITFVTNGTDVISESDFTATLDLNPVASSVVADQSGALASLKKNGSSAQVNLALKPGGAYSNYVRISNTSGLEGKFYVTVIADNGQTASLTLDEIAGQPAALAARASTTQMTIQQIFEAAAAKGLALSGEGKLRLVVEGEVPSLDVQTYTVSKDGNSFATF